MGLSLDAGRVYAQHAGKVIGRRAGHDRRGLGDATAERGLPVGACPDAWNLAQPELVEQIARAYVEAGSQVILTNTFGSNRFILSRHHLAGQVAAINEAGVAISRRAAGRALVWASMGPSGVMLMMGEATPGELQAAFAEQAEALARAGADGIVIETMSDPAEAALAVAAAGATGLPVVASMTFGSAKQDRTLMGTTPEQAAEQLLAAGADLAGANCGQGIAGFVDMPPPARRQRAARLDQGQRRAARVRDGRAAYRETAAEFAAYVPGPGGGGGRADRRLLRHHAGVRRRGVRKKLAGMAA